MFLSRGKNSVFYIQQGWGLRILFSEYVNPPSSGSAGKLGLRRTWERELRFWKRNHRHQMFRKMDCFRRVGVVLKEGRYEGDGGY